MSISTALLLRGLLAVAIGIVSVAWPNITVGAAVILFAIYWFVAAITDALRAFSSDRAGSVVGWLVLAVLSASAGVIALGWPGTTALALVIWVAAWAFITGLVEVGLAFRQGEAAGQRAVWTLTGLISVALGIVLIIRPDIGVASLATVFGLFSLVYGVAAVVLAFRAREAASTARRSINPAV